jgi:hypothetical protein
LDRAPSSRSGGFLASAGGMNGRDPDELGGDSAAASRSPHPRPVCRLCVCHPASHRPVQSQRNFANREVAAGCDARTLMVARACSYCLMSKVHPTRCGSGHQRSCDGNRQVSRTAALPTMRHRLVQAVPDHPAIRMHRSRWHTTSSSHTDNVDHAADMLSPRPTRNPDLHTVHGSGSGCLGIDLDRSRAR